MVRMIKGNASFKALVRWKSHQERNAHYTIMLGGLYVFFLKKVGKLSVSQPVNGPVSQSVNHSVKCSQ